VGQDQAKIVFSTAVHNHYKRIKHNASLKPTEAVQQVTYEPPITFYPKSECYINI